MQLKFGWKSWVLMAVAVVLAGVALGQILVETPEPENALPMGPAASDFALESPDGSVIRLSDNKGRVVLINFWADVVRTVPVRIAAYPEVARTVSQ